MKASGRASIAIVDADGTLIDQHASRVECVFPADGEFAYLQRNRFEWPDGRVQTAEFGGALRDGRVFWDTERFYGYGWATDGDVLLLRLTRRDEPETTFTEIIALEDGQNRRFRTWHWFQNGVPVRRTLCDEQRMA